MLCGVTTVQARDRQCFDKNWRFYLGDSANMAQPDFDDSSWRLLDVPHDWAIEGDFYVSNPSGAGGGALPGGIGWYRKHFTITQHPSPITQRPLLLDSVCQDPYQPPQGKIPVFIQLTAISCVIIMKRYCR